MSEVGIIVNPYAGRDLRRLTTQASNVSHGEKTRKVLRIMHALEMYGVEKVYLMPDNYQLNSRIAKLHGEETDSTLQVERLRYTPLDKPEETTKAAEMMIEKGIRCLIVLGGDGTNRLVAKSNIAVPVISISTGTNNAYPSFLEETTAGIAAAYIASQNGDGRRWKRAKQIEVHINDRPLDIALIDASITDVPFVGSKVVSDISEVKDLIVCRCGPNLIGLASVVGSIKICEDDDEFGYRTKIGDTAIKTTAAFSSGQIIEVEQSEPVKMPLGSPYTIRPPFSGTIVLDGERTLTFRKNDELKFVVTRNGPIKGKVKEILYEAVRDGFYMM
jgi:hypothetical protein